MRRVVFIILMSLVFTFSHAQEWPDWRGANRDGIWKGEGIVQKFDENPIPVKWSVPVGPGYTGPTVANGKVYLMDRIEKPDEQERILCFDAETGKAVWSFSYDCSYESVGYPAGPRASVVIHEGKAYSLGTMGHLFCFNAITGQVLWQNDLQKEYHIRMPIWGIAATPLICGEKIILQIGGSNNACVVALDKNTGNEIWRNLDDGASYSAPIVIERDGKKVLIVWTADNLAGLDPDSGEAYWKIAFPLRMAMGISTPVVYGDYIFVSSFYGGALLANLDKTGLKAEKVWMRAGENERKTDALHCVINTPVIKEGYIYGVDSYGELRCLDLKTGDRIWENLTAVNKNRWANIHFIEHGDKTWMFNEHGELLITELSPGGLKVISRARLIEPTIVQLNRSGTGVTWSHPAFVNSKVYIRNDRELVCADLKSKN